MKYFVSTLLLSIALIFFGITSAPPEVKHETPSKIDSDFSLCQKQVIPYHVIIHTALGRGSGTIFKHKDKIYVLTCGHVVSSIDERVKIARINKDDEYLEDHRIVFNAKVINRTAVEEEGGKDIAILEVLTKSNFFKEGVKFYPGCPVILDEIVHTGYLYGEYGNSILRGHIINHISFPDLNNQNFYIVHLESRPGSSGGGIFAKKDGEYMYCGMLCRGYRGGVSLVKPVCVIQEWMKTQGF